MENLNTSASEQEDLRLLEKCRSLIETKLGWGSADTWATRDFQTLCDKIETETGINLSVATLKRIWGKVRYTSKPTITTLDTLARFIGYENWRVFRVEFGVDEKIVSPVTGERQVQTETTQAQTKPVRRRSYRSLILACATLVVFSVFFFFKLKSSGSARESVPSYEFTSKKILSSEVPNSVIFEYNAGNATDEDTVFVQQSWDTRLRTRVPASGTHHTSIYYYPGFFQAKLVINNKIVKEHDIFIPTNGWLPVIEQEPVPVYLAEASSIHDGVMTIPLKTLTDNNIPLQPHPPWVAFHNARTFDSLQTDNFIFETEVRNDFREGSGVCQLTEIHIRFEGGLFMIPLSSPGCVSALAIYDVDGKKPDPSGLGCDLSSWVNVRCEVRDRKGTLTINGKKVYDLNYDLSPRAIVGLLYRFQGTGSVNYARFSNVHGNVVFEDAF